MSRLLRGDFRRLFKSKTFYLCIAYMFLYACVATFSRIYEGKILREPGYDTPDGLLFGGIMCLSVVVSIFVSIFIWTDGTDGIWRNKVVVGFRKTDIFFSYWIVTGAATVLFHLVYVLCVLFISAFGLDSFKIPTSVNVVLIFCSLLAVLAFNSFVVLICSLSPNKALCIVFSVLFMMGLWSVGLTARSDLAQPEFFEGLTYVDSYGNINKIPRVENTNYLSGVKRKIVQFIADFLPSGQSYALNQVESFSLSMIVWIVYSSAFCFLTAFVSFAVFKRRELK